MSEPDSFPRLSARTQRFRLGAPRDITVCADGSRVAFVRSAGPTDRVGRLWVLDVATGTERLVVDPVALLGAGEEDLPPAERARRERLREAAGGVTAYATSESGDLAALALGGRIVVADLAGGNARVLEVPGPVIDPRPSPDGRLVAYVVAGALRVVDLATGEDRVLASPEAPEVTWGLAEFVAAEDMHRFRGFWWSPGSDAILAARVDEAPVQTWWIANPARPEDEPIAVRYPATGTPNAQVSLAVLGLDGSRVDVAWDTAALPYLAAASWSRAPLLLLQSRDQRHTRTVVLDPVGGGLSVLREDSDEHWVELVPGVPALLPDGRLVHTLDDGDTRRLAIDGVAVTAPGLQVESVTQVDDGGVVFRATEDAVDVGVWAWDAVSGEVDALTEGSGLYAARRAGGTTVLSSAGPDWHGTRVTVVRSDATRVPLVSLAADPPLTAAPHAVFRAGPRELRTAVLLPSDRERFPGRLPVVCDPYAGPGHREVTGAQASWLEPQWLADQGFAVVVADGRGTPGRGPRWERAIATGWSEAVLEDQVDAVAAAGERFPDDLDLTRVGIRGWSFGGYLAALAVLRRPDVFAAAVAGAPVTDWTLYDTHYTERYLGHPAEHPDRYARMSLINDAPALTRPLLLIHGLADDNVVVANTLRLSAALLAAGRQHAVLPLTGVTHMTSQEVVAENLVLLQVQFLREHLASSPTSPGQPGD